jgi:hypothetical protein
MWVHNAVCCGIDRTTLLCRLMLAQQPGCSSRTGPTGGATWFLGSPAFEVAGEQEEVKLTNQTHVAWNGRATKKTDFESRFIKL